MGYNIHEHKDSDTTLIIRYYLHRAFRELANLSR